MNVEVEIRFRIEDSDKCRAQLLKVSKLIGNKHQVDEYFEHPVRNFTANKELKEYLRVRTTGEKSSLDYHKCIIKQNEKSHTEEFESQIQKPEIVKTILLELGFKPKVIVDKRRETFETENLTICFDKIENLGSFLEVEAKKLVGTVDETKEACQKFAESLHLNLEKAPEGGYPDLLLAKTNSF